VGDQGEPRGVRRALTTAGGLVFYGTMEGWLKGVDQKSGKVLWQYKTRPASSATR
jgi:glucose dehydrogenase